MSKIMEILLKNFNICPPPKKQNTHKNGIVKIFMNLRKQFFFLKNLLELDESLIFLLPLHFYFQLLF